MLQFIFWTAVQVNYEYFHTFLEQNYNTEFGTPSTDVRSFCLMHNETIKASHNKEEKLKLQAELTVHKAKAKAFYDVLRIEMKA